MIITFYCSDDEGEGRLVIDEEEEEQEKKRRWERGKRDWEIKGKGGWRRNYSTTRL